MTGFRLFNKDESIGVMPEGFALGGMMRLGAVGDMDVGTVGDMDTGVAGDMGTGAVGDMDTGVAGDIDVGTVGGVKTPALCCCCSCIGAGCAGCLLVLVRCVPKIAVCLLEIAGCVLRIAVCSLAIAGCLLEIAGCLPDKDEPGFPIEVSDATVASSGPKCGVGILKAGVAVAERAMAGPCGVADG
jgi:hypothetical protein